MPVIFARDKGEVLAVLIKIAMEYALNYELGSRPTPEQILEGFQHYVNENLAVTEIYTYLRQCR